MLGWISYLGAPRAGTRGSDPHPCRLPKACWAALPTWVRPGFLGPLRVGLTLTLGLRYVQRHAGLGLSPARLSLAAPLLPLLHHRLMMMHQLTFRAGQLVRRSRSEDCFTPRCVQHARGALHARPCAARRCRAERARRARPAHALTRRAAARARAGAANAGVPLAMIVQRYGWDAFFIAMIASCAIVLLLLAPMTNLKSYSQREAQGLVKAA